MSGTLFSDIQRCIEKYFNEENIDGSEKKRTIRNRMDFFV